MKNIKRSSTLKGSNINNPGLQSGGKEQNVTVFGDLFGPANKMTNTDIKQTKSIKKMKNQLITIMLFIAIIFTASSCAKDRMWVKGHGSDVKVTRNLSNFTGVSLSMDANVELYQDSVYHVELNGQQNVLDVIETNVSGSTLNIRLRKCTNLRHHNTVTIRVYMPSLNNLDISGSGDVKGMNNLKTESLDVNISGSGSLSLDGIITNSFEANISGSGNITFYGNNSCNSAKYTVSGSGNLNAEWLRVDIVDARVSGSGEIKLYAVKQLDATISGSGDIIYRGSPNTNIKISGSGKVRSSN